MIGALSADRAGDEIQQATDVDLVGRALALAHKHDLPLSMSMPLTAEQHAAISAYLFETADTSDVLRELARRVERRLSPAEGEDSSPVLPPLPSRGSLPFGLAWWDLMIAAAILVSLVALIVAPRS